MTFQASEPPVVFAGAFAFAPPRRPISLRWSTRFFPPPPLALPRACAFPRFGGGFTVTTGFFSCCCRFAFYCSPYWLSILAPLFLTFPPRGAFLAFLSPLAQWRWRFQFFWRRIFPFDGQSPSGILFFFFPFGALRKSRSQSLQVLPVAPLCFFFAS